MKKKKRKIRTNSVIGLYAAGGANAIAATKRLLTELDGSGDGELAARGADLSASVLATPEARERLAAAFNR